MGVLIDGEWRSNGVLPSDDTGKYQRETSQFRNSITADGSSGFPAAAGRYHLYVSNACPWCHRTLLIRTLKGLQNVVSLSVVEPLMLERDWEFREPDPITGAKYAYELYQFADPLYTGRVTLPLLWDKETNSVVSNESADIIRMFNSEFEAFTEQHTDYYPEELAAQIDAINLRIEDTVSNGVYRAGFAAKQGAYEAAVNALFSSLEWLEERLQKQRYLVGDRPTDADWRLFPTLVRFDVVYHGLFKCDRKHVYEYPALWAYTRELYQIAGVADTVHLDEYRTHYYGSYKPLNPSGVVAVGPVLDFTPAHGRESVPSAPSETGALPALGEDVAVATDVSAVAEIVATDADVPAPAGDDLFKSGAARADAGNDEGVSSTDDTVRAQALRPEDYEGAIILEEIPDPTIEMPAIKEDEGLKKLA